MSRVFEASYPGRCEDCDERIHEGDLVRYASDRALGLVHADCATVTPREPVVRPMCPDCFTELPLTGICGSCT